MTNGVKALKTATTRKEKISLIGVFVVLVVLNMLSQMHRDKCMFIVNITNSKCEICSHLTRLKKVIFIFNCQYVPFVVRVENRKSNCLLLTLAVT